MLQSSQSCARWKVETQTIQFSYVYITFKPPFESKVKQFIQKLLYNSLCPAVCLGREDLIFLASVNDIQMNFCVNSILIPHQRHTLFSPLEKHLKDHVLQISIILLFNVFNFFCLSWPKMNISCLQSTHGYSEIA